VHAGLQLLFDLLQFGTQAIGNRFAFDRERPLSGRPATMGEAQGVECLRLALPPLLASFGRIAAEFDEPGFLRV
jgi:hypothetical protein